MNAWVLREIEVQPDDPSMSANVYVDDVQVGTYFEGYTGASMVWADDEPLAERLRQTAAEAGVVFAALVAAKLPADFDARPEPAVFDERD